MRKYIETFILAVLGGICVGLGGMIFLSVESRVLGSFLFAIGLFTICTMGLNLFTGKVCYVFENDLRYAVGTGVIWLGNFAGTWLSAMAIRATRVAPVMMEKAAALCSVKLGDSVLSIFILAILCNIMIYISVESYRKNPHELGKYLAIFVSIMVFILCGFEHCVANMFYFSLAGAWQAKSFAYLLVMTLGNAVGGVLFPLLRSAAKPKNAV